MADSARRPPPSGAGGYYRSVECANFRRTIEAFHGSFNSKVGNGLKKAYANSMATGAIETEIGWIEFSADKDVLTHVAWRGVKPARLSSSPLIKEAQRQLTLYFERRLTRFDLPMVPDGTAFAQEVWKIMRAIPYGETLTYGDVAARLQMPAQAVGQACGQNPIAIIIPCHRVVGTGWIGGYSSELGNVAKSFLLDLESGQQRLF